METKEEKVKIHKDIRSLCDILDRHKIRYKKSSYCYNWYSCITVPVLNNCKIHFAYARKVNDDGALFLDHICTMINGEEINSYTSLPTDVETSFEIKEDEIFYVKSRLENQEKIEIILWTVALTESVASWNGSVDLSSSVMYKNQ